jgi:group I intron endonuclease
MNKNISFLKEIVWFDIDKRGYINTPLKNQGAVYIYMKVSNKTEYYVGASLQLKTRISSHRCCINGNNYKSKGSPLFYKSVLKYGWVNFKFGVLEYIDLSKISNIKQKKDKLLEREQYYLDNINPSLNICKIAGSVLGIKHGITFSRNLSKSRRGIRRKVIKLSVKKIHNVPKVVTIETRIKLSSRTQGVSVKVFDGSNLINKFTTITSAAKHLGVNNKTISRILNTGISYDNYIYIFEIKDLRVWIYDPKYKLVKILDNVLKTSAWCNIPYTTISRYIKSGKLYGNKYYFYNINSKSNPYYGNKD